MAQAAAGSSSATGLHASAVLNASTTCLCTVHQCEVPTNRPSASSWQNLLGMPSHVARASIGTSNTPHAGALSGLASPSWCLKQNEHDRIKARRRSLFLGILSLYTNLGNSKISRSRASARLALRGGMGFSHVPPNRSGMATLRELSCCTTDFLVGLSRKIHAPTCTR